MADFMEAEVFMSGTDQAVRIQTEYRIASDRGFIRRDPQSGDLILSQTPRNWAEVFAALDEAGFADDFLRDREQGHAEVREDV